MGSLDPPCQLSEWQQQLGTNGKYIMYHFSPAFSKAMNYFENTVLMQMCYYYQLPHLHSHLLFSELSSEIFGFSDSCSLCQVIHHQKPLKMAKNNDPLITETKLS